ncbi:MAG: VWA domain-containing protein [Thermomicrobiales bacterium]
MTTFDANALAAVWERTAVSAGGDHSHLLITLKAPARTTDSRSAPVDVAFALDRSGSMTGEPIQLVKAAVDMAAGLLAEKDRAALVVYDNVIDVIHPLQDVTPASRQRLRSALGGIDARGSTNLGEGWMQACLQLADSPNPNNDSSLRLKRALLLTDGLANQGITDPDQLVTHVVNLRQRGISTSTLGVGDEFDETLLESMAEAGGGNFQFIPTPAELPAFFERELGRLLATVATQVVVSLTFSTGILAKPLSMFPSRQHEQQVIIELGDLPEGEELALAISVQTPPAMAGTLLTAAMSLSWFDARTGRQHVIERSAPALPVAPAGSALLTERNDTVAEEAAVQQAALDQREAMRLDRLGEYAASRHAHARAGSLLASAPQTSRVSERHSEALTFASFGIDSAIPEQVRKQAIHNTYRRGRGRSDES